MTLTTVERKWAGSGDEYPARPEQRRRRFRLTERVTVTLLSFAVYVTVGAILVFKYDSIQTDALARVSQSYAVLFSRDPKLAAIGFVWSPLPVLLMIPFLPLKLLWAGLTERGFLINIESAVAMAAAVGLLSATLKDWGVRRGPRIALVLCFAAHPLIVLYGANGMTEALLILCLLAAVRHLAAWLRNRSTGQLALGATFLGLGYLTRYEAIGAALACIAGVAVVSFLRTNGSWRQRRSVALADALIASFPPAAAFIAWALISWVIVGSPFDQFTSVYGNSAQLRGGLGKLTVSALPHPMKLLVTQVIGLEPLLVVIVLLACVHSVWRRNPRILVVLAGIGSVVALQVLLFLRGQTADWLRFKILVIPLAILSVGCFLSGSTSDEASARHRRRLRRAGSRFATASLASLVVVALCAPAIPATASMLSSYDLAPEEASHLPATFAVHQPHNSLPPGSAVHSFAADRQIAAYVDRMNVPDGAVLADTALAFGIVLAAKHPKRFVITSDRDFEAAVADPASFHVQYLLVSPGHTGMDALVTQYPTLYENGAGIATLEHTFSTPVGAVWRLYRVHGLT